MPTASQKWPQKIALEAHMTTNAFIAGTIRSPTTKTQFSVSIICQELSTFMTCASKMYFSTCPKDEGR